MLLGNLLNVDELHDLISRKFIRVQTHPTLPLSILNYSNECMFEDFWPETVQICRGLVVENTTNLNGKIVPGLIPESKVISRPFHKFFNLNQSNRSDYQEANLPKVVPTVTEKMDGWFGSLWKYGDSYGIASRGSFTSPGAEFSTSKLAKLIKYGAIEEFPQGYTPIFEIIFKAGKVVVDYPFEGLVLLGLVNVETGEELPYDELQVVWAKIAGYSADNRPWIRLVKAHRMDLLQCSTHTEKNFEGFVLTYPRPGTWPIKVKVKLEEYKQLHRLITGVTPQQVWKILHDPTAVWFNNDIPDHFRTWASDWRSTLLGQFHEILAAAMELTYQWKPEFEAGSVTRKEILKDMQATDSKNAELAMTLLDGKIFEAYRSIWARIRPIGRDCETFYREGQGE